MKEIFKLGDEQEFIKTVNPEDVATFDQGLVHPVYATFALGRDAEWTCRLFVLEMKEAHEEGIGTFLNVTHHSPALLGQEVRFLAKIIKLSRNEIICEYWAKVGERLIAQGTTGQKILPKQKLEKLFNSL